MLISLSFFLPVGLAMSMSEASTSLHRVLKFKSAILPSVGTFMGIPTPAPVLRTYLGNPILSTPDDLDCTKDNFFAQLEISDLIAKPFRDVPLRELYKPHERAVLILSSRGMVTQTAGCDAGGLKIDSHGGRKHVSVADYLARAQIDLPPVILAMADEVEVNAGKKRLSRAVERSLNWFHELTRQAAITSTDHEARTSAKASTSSPSIDIVKDASDHTAVGAAAAGDETQDSTTKATGWSLPKSTLFGIAQYNPHNPEQLRRVVAHMLEQGAQGMVVGGLHMGEDARQRVEAIRSVRAQLPKHIPTLVQGADTLSDIMLSLEEGVDLISGNYPQLLASRGHATAVPIILLEQHQLQPETTRVVKLGFESDGEPQKEGISTAPAAAPDPASVKRSAAHSSTPQPDHGSKRARHADSSEAVALDTKEETEAVAEAAVTVKAGRLEMDLWDPQYAKDSRPLVSGCGCHACQHHSRAYLHHLLVAREMLAELLLFHHSQYQLLQIFQAARAQASAGTFAQWAQQLH